MSEKIITGSTQPDSDVAFQERHTEILGRPPRLAPLDRKDAAGLALANWKKLRGPITGQNAELPPDAVIPEIYFYMLRYPELWDRIAAMSVQLQGSGLLPARDRELVILRVGWLCQAPFEFGEHVRVAKRLGISSDEIDRVKAAYPEATYVGLADGAKENWLYLGLKTEVQSSTSTTPPSTSGRRPGRCSRTTPRGCGRGSTAGATG